MILSKVSILGFVDEQITKETSENNSNLSISSASALCLEKKPTAFRWVLARDQLHLLTPVRSLTEGNQALFFGLEMALKIKKRDTQT